MVLKTNSRNLFTAFLKKTYCKSLTENVSVASPFVCLSPDRYALLRVLQPLDAAQVMWQAVRCVTSQNGDHNLWLQQGRLGLRRLLHQRHQLRHAAGHQSDQQRPQHTDSHGPDRPHLRFQIQPCVLGLSERAAVRVREGGTVPRWEGERGRKIK